MGEAKRKKREQEDRETRVRAARYRPVEIVLAIRRQSEEDDAELDARIRDLADLARMPNAMRPRGWEGAGTGAVAGLVGTVRDGLAGGKGYAVLDREGKFLRRMPAVEFGTAYQPTDLDGCMYYADAGEETEISASLRGGFLGPDGEPVEDIRAALSGLARVDSMGGYIVAADAPLTLQAAAIHRLLGMEEDKDVVEGLFEHLRHLVALTKAIQRLPVREPDTMLDLCAFDELVDDVVEGEFGDLKDYAQAREACAKLLSDFDTARRDAPVWTLGATLWTDHASWMSRDTPSCGGDWVRIDKLIANLPWTGDPAMPNDDAQFLLVPKEWTEVVKQAQALFDGRVLIAEGESKVVHDEARGLYIAWVEKRRSFVLVAWPERTAGIERRDPLMAEFLVGYAETPPTVGEAGPREFGGRGYDEWMDAFADLTIHDVMPQPVQHPLHAPFLFLAAHRRNMGIPDLLQSLAAAVRCGCADAAFMRHPDLADDLGAGVDPNRDLEPEERKARDAFAGRAIMFGGEVRDPIVALFKFTGPGDWVGVDLNEDMAELLEGMRAGMTLEDFAVVTMTNLRGIRPRIAVATAG